MFSSQATPDFVRSRNIMVECQIAARGLEDARVLEAMREVPRERFVDEESQPFAYDDEPLPIAEGQTISQPYIVALTSETAELKSTDRVLEVGAGSGYAAAVMSRIVLRVYGIERFASLVEIARKRLDDLGYDNIELRAGDGTSGWPEAARFDAIVVSASASRVPTALTEQLAIGGRFVMPVGRPGQRFRQTLLKLKRVSSTEYEEYDLGPVAFVPLVSAELGSPPRG